MPVSFHVLNNSIQVGLAVFLISFAALAIYLMMKRRATSRSSDESAASQYFTLHDRPEKPAVAPPAPVSAIPPKPLALSLAIAAAASLILAAIITVTLAFSPLSFLVEPSADADADKIELRSLEIEWSADTISLSGRITNISGRRIEDVTGRLIIYDQFSVRLAEHPFNVIGLLPPSQTVPFRVTQRRPAEARRAGLAFYSSNLPLPHKENPALKQP
jgi:hypothetical protein